jgi:hypothetical protein
MYTHSSTQGTKPKKLTMFFCNNTDHPSRSAMPNTEAIVDAAEHLANIGTIMVVDKYLAAHAKADRISNLKLHNSNNMQRKEAK